VLLAAYFRGNKDLLALSRFTGAPLERIEEYGARLRKAGVWLDDGVTCCCRDEPDGKRELAFWLDVSIAPGLVKKLGDDKYAGAGSASEKLRDETALALSPASQSAGTRWRRSIR
jgi:hypothetical protein